MAGNSNLILAGISGSGAAGNSLSYFAPLGTTAPVDGVTALVPTWQDAGWCSDSGIAIKTPETTKEITAYGTFSPVRSFITQSKFTFDLTMLESNPTSLALYHRKPLSSLVPSLAAPASPVLSVPTTVATGGNMVASTVSYRVTATNATSESLPSAEITVVIPNGSATNAVVLAWPLVTGATGYRIYGRTPGAELFIGAVGAVGTFTDPGTVTPAGAMPTTLPANGLLSFSTGGASLPHCSAVFDMVDGNNHLRAYCPDVAVVARGDLAIKAGEAVQYPITLTAFPDITNVSVKWFYVLDAFGK